MKQLTRWTIASVLFFVSVDLYANSAIRSRNYTCNQIRQLVQAEGEVKIRGFLGAVTVHSSRRGCGRYQRAVRSTWRTSDAFFCTVGFGCKAYNNDDDDDDNA